MLQSCNFFGNCVVIDPLLPGVEDQTGYTLDPHLAALRSQVDESVIFPDDVCTFIHVHVHFFTLEDPEPHACPSCPSIPTRAVHGAASVSPRCVHGPSRTLRHPRPAEGPGAPAVWALLTRPGMALLRVLVRPHAGVKFLPFHLPGDCGTCMPTARDAPPPTAATLCPRSPPFWSSRAS